MDPYLAATRLLNMMSSWSLEGLKDPEPPTKIEGYGVTPTGGFSSRSIFGM